jgi:serine/threonine-protein kinase
MVLAGLSAWITVYLMIDSKAMEVPDLVGMDYNEGREILDRLRLKIRRSSVEFSQEYPQDKIIAQSPPAGRRLKMHRTVKVVISGGSQRITMPVLEGLSLREARIMIEHKKLRLGKISRIFCRSHAADRVIAQDPDPRSPVIANSKINLLVSIGAPKSWYVMPDLVKKPYQEAKTFLIKAGLKLGNVRTKNYPGVTPGIVIEQYPPCGHRMSTSDIINLWVSGERSES